MLFWDIKHPLSRFLLFLTSLNLSHFPRDNITENRDIHLDWDAAQAKANAFVARLNLTEKIHMVTGASSIDAGVCIGNIRPIKRLSFNGMCFSDGPAGVNRAELVSVFPSGVTAAATWDRDLIYQRGIAIGEEFKGKGAHLMLGPAVGPMGRHPLGGRNWEGFGPDPYLSGASVAATIRGVQSTGVQTCTKHFIGNEQETQRSNTTAPDGTIIPGISSNIDDRTLHELYLWPFTDAVKAGTTSLMCSYNRLNSTYACENPKLLNDILKKELGFRGYVVSDWFATHSTTSSANTGLDLEMPGELNPYGAGALPGRWYFGDFLLRAIQNGSVSTDRLDEMVSRVMVSYYLLGQDDNYPSVDPSTIAVIVANEIGLPMAQKIGFPFEVVPARDVRANHSSLIRQIAVAGTVLLKNVNSTLPLQKPKYIAVFGNDAADITDGQRTDNYGYDIGTAAIGGGSGTIRLGEIISPLDAIKIRAKRDSTQVKYTTNNAVISAGNFQGIYPLPDICLVFLKTWASEDHDRVSFELDYNSTQVVENVATWCNNTIVIMHSAGVNTLPWAIHPNVKAILAAHYPGEQSGNSIVDVLWGDSAPSGRLPYTIPKNESDAAAPIANQTGSKDWQADFSEGQLIDYRHYDANSIEPLYEFGFGLAYTTFEMTANLSVKAVKQNPPETPDSARQIEVGGHPDLWVELLEVETAVSNTGSRPGVAVPQLYISFPSSVPEGTPVKVLRGFEKVQLEPAQSKRVTFKLLRRDLSYWDVVSQTWTLPAGEFVFRTGFSSRDLKGEAKLKVRGV
ncbi:glycoside hydrolase family 3 protein [Zopfia rhizophila CBS 207.26]|uniref:Probable beta-glucosidase G n=1 Tax=Zopfia rhizophila CBS 207.26 TaxID=1314779 RepID=A0A6A6ETF5_9PEZI|nr:glycoside hydrolase family 3 protein [Zopfia rhizophila CBS 207.26]